MKSSQQQVMHTALCRESVLEGDVVTPMPPALIVSTQDFGLHEAPIIFPTLQFQSVPVHSKILEEKVKKKELNYM